jgi:hypothetical protein
VSSSPWCHQLLDVVATSLRHVGCSFWALLALGLSSCVLGGQTGGEEAVKRADDNGTGTTPGGGKAGVPATDGSEDGGLAIACAVERSPLTVDTLTSLGFAPSEVLAWAVGRRGSTILWNDDTGLVAFGPETGEGSLVLTVTYDQGSINLVTLVNPAACGEPYVELEVTASLTTGGKALDEVFPVMLLVRSLEDVTFTANISFAELKGELVLDLPAGQVADHITVEAALVPDGSLGTVYCPIEQSTADTTTEMMLPLMRWPSPALLSKTTDK